MPYRSPPRRSMLISINPLQLTGSIALSLWLGFMAIDKSRANVLQFCD